MKATYISFDLKLKHPFTISGFSRTSTPLLLLKLSAGGEEGYGEASMVPYFGETYAGAAQFLARIDWSRFTAPFNFPELRSYLDDLEQGRSAIKAAVDIALHDLQGKLLDQPCYRFFNAEPSKMPPTAYTIGMADKEVILEKVAEAKEFKVLKIKLGSADDRALIRTIRSVSSLPLYVDANQGWTNRKEAIDLIYWLHDHGVVLIEQPMDKNNIDGNAWLTGRSPVPILADEAVQRLGDLDRIRGAYHGVNIKLMKCGGMYEAGQMISKARKLGMKVMIGCMSETSVATQAAMALAPLCNWADLDGPFLTTNNPFDPPLFQQGHYRLEDLPGLGLKGLPTNLFHP